MKHQQLLDKLAARHLVQALDEDIARLVWNAITLEKHGEQQSRTELVLPRLYARWNSILQADENQVPALYRHKTWLALATLLHRYGLADSAITNHAITAINELNRAVALDDAFYRSSGEFVQGLQSPPAPMMRRPSLPDHITFYRARDLIAIHLNGRFHAAYVHDLASINESPIIEFYAQAFDHIPTLNELQPLSAQGELYNDGTLRRSLYSVSGIKFQPDPAAQVTLISACISNPPNSNDLAPAIGLYTVSDIFRIQDVIQKMFG